MYDDIFIFRILYEKAHINTHPTSASTTRTRHAALEGPYVLDTHSYNRHPKPARVCQDKTFYFIRMVISLFKQEWTRSWFRDSREWLPI